MDEFQGGLLPDMPGTPGILSEGISHQTLYIDQLLRDSVRIVPPPHARS
ncbi:MAG: hypothetical protein ACOX37_12790 [Bacillota bacterium]